MKNILTILTLLIVININAQKKMTNLFTTKNNQLLDSLLQSNPALKSVLQNKVEANVQIIYTKIDRDENNIPQFTDYTYNLNKNNYFYPASTVKMPIAFLALEKLNELNKYGIDKNTTMLTDSNYSKQSMVFTQPTAENSNPTIANYIKQIFLVSDNDAFNRLYEFLGQEYIQKRLKKKGYSDVAIRHRLQISLTQEQNKATNAISFYDTSGTVLYAQPAQYSKATFKEPIVQLGKGYYKGNQLINEPFDFTIKNRVYLQDLHNISRSVLFNEFVPAKQRFNLTKDDYDFVLHWMSAFPKESKYPSYNNVDYWDSYCKFLLLGSEKNAVPENIRIFNKVGDAYGYLIDVAYIIDTKNNIEFMVSVAISCNSDGIYNDDKYDYDKIGFPFMKNVGKTLYEYELKRERKHVPDLSKFKLTYEPQ